MNVSLLFINKKMISNRSVSSDTLTSLYSNVQLLSNLSKCMDLLMIGNLKTSAKILIESIKSTNNEYVNRIIMDCQRLGLLVQAYKFILKGNKYMIDEEYSKALLKYGKVDLRDVTKEIAFQLLHNKGVCLVMLERCKEAISLFEIALQLVPGDDLTMGNLAFTKMLTFEYEDALTIFTEIIGMDHIHPYRLLSILYGSAECRLHLGIDCSHSDVVTDDTMKNLQKNIWLSKRIETTDNSPEKHYKQQQHVVQASILGDDDVLIDYYLSPKSIISSNNDKIQSQTLEGNKGITEWCINPMRQSSLSTKTTEQFDESHKESTALINNNHQQLSNISINDIEIEAMGSPHYSLQSKNKREQLRNAVSAFQRNSFLALSSLHHQNKEVNELVHQSTNTIDCIYTAPMCLLEKNQPEHTTVLSSSHSFVSSAETIFPLKEDSYDSANLTSYLKKFHSSTNNTANNIQSSAMIQRNPITTVFSLADKPIRPIISNNNTTIAAAVVSVKTSSISIGRTNNNKKLSEAIPTSATTTSTNSNDYHHDQNEIVHPEFTNIKEPKAVLSNNLVVIESKIQQISSDVASQTLIMSSELSRENKQFQLLPIIRGNESQYQLDQHRLFDQKKRVDAYLACSNINPDPIGGASNHLHVDNHIHHHSSQTQYASDSYSTKNLEESIGEYYTINDLQAPGPYPSNVDIRHRELYLSDKEFEKVFNLPKNRWKQVPVWKKVSLKKAAGLF